MAVKLATANGLMTAAGTWQDVSSLSDYEPTQMQLVNTWQGAGAFTPGAITIDGILLKIGHRVAVPSGTVSVRLWNSTDALAVAGTTVTINVSDVPAVQVAATSAWTTVGWVYFKFAAPVALTAGKNYIVQATTSVSFMVSVPYTGAAYTYSRGVVITGAAAAAPTTGDQVIICGAWTAPATQTAVAVTMDQTSSAVKYGTTSTTTPTFNVDDGGRLDFGGPAAGNPPAAATNYYLNLQAVLHVGTNGVLTIGTVANPVPRDSTARLNFDITGAAGSYFGFIVGTLIAQGLSRTVGKDVVGCLLIADAAAGAVTVTVDRDTGWKSGDLVALAGTLRTSGRSEIKTLNADAGASSLAWAAGLSYAHQGDLANGLQAEVVLRTRNVVIGSTTAGKQSALFCVNGSTLDFDWVSFWGMGGTATYRGISMNAPASFNCDHCHFDGNGATSNVSGFSQYDSAGSTPLPAITVTHLTGFGIFDYLAYLTGGTSLWQTATFTAEDCWVVGDQTYGAAGLFADKSYRRLLTLRRCRVGDSYSTNPSVLLNPPAGWPTAGANPAEILLEDCTFHDNGTPIRVDGATAINIRLSGCRFWRSKVAGSYGAALYFLSGIQNFLAENCEFLSGYSGAIYLETSRNCVDVVFRNCKFGGETSYPSFNLLTHGANGGIGAAGIHDIRFESCLFGDAAGGVFKDYTDADFGTPTPRPDGLQYDLVLANVTSGTATQFSANWIAAQTYRSRVRKQRWGGVLGDHSTWYPRLGTVARDAVFFRTSAPSEKLTPGGATAYVRLQSAPKRFDVSTGFQRTPFVYVYLDPTYNGLAPRLIMRANSPIGQLTDAVLATHSGATGVWERLAGIMPVPSEDDGQVEIFVDCTGTAGAAWCDDWGI